MTRRKAVHVKQIKLYPDEVSARVIKRKDGYDRLAVYNKEELIGHIHNDKRGKYRLLFAIPAHKGCLNVFQTMPNCLEYIWLHRNCEGCYDA